MSPRIGFTVAACVLGLAGLGACSLVVSTSGLAGGTSPSGEGGTLAELDGGGAETVGAGTEGQIGDGARVDRALPVVINGL